MEGQWLESLGRLARTQQVGVARRRNKHDLHARIPFDRSNEREY